MPTTAVMGYGQMPIIIGKEYLRVMDDDTAWTSMRAENLG